MIQVYKKNELFIIENTVTDIIYPNLTREEALVLLKKFDRDEPEDRCDFAIKEDNVSFEYASIDDKDQQIADLEAKLAEKEKENLTLFSMLYETLEKQGCDNVASQIEQMTNLTLEKQSNWFKGNCVKDQDKISFAVEQLEKVKSFCISAEDNGWCVTHKNWLEIVEYIDNQIKAIKGEK